MLYNFSTAILARLLLPTGLRTAFNHTFLNAWLKPLTTLYASFTDYRTTTLYYLGHTSQTCYMEAALNDTFDPTGRAIKIKDGPVTDPLYLYRTLESKPAYIYLKTETTHTYIHTHPEIWTGAADFYVQVPTAVVFNIPHLTSLVKKYKLPGRSFEITTI